MRFVGVLVKTLWFYVIIAISLLHNSSKQHSAVLSSLLFLYIIGRTLSILVPIASVGSLVAFCNV